MPWRFATSESLSRTCVLWELLLVSGQKCNECINRSTQRQNNIVHTQYTYKKHDQLQHLWWAWMRAPSVIKGMSAHLVIGKCHRNIKLQSYPITTKMTISYGIAWVLHFQTITLTQCRWQGGSWGCPPGLRSQCSCQNWEEKVHIYDGRCVESS